MRQFIRRVLSRIIPRDEERRCGIWPFVIDDPPFLDACKVHDEMYDKARQKDGSYDPTILREADDIFKTMLWEISRGKFFRRLRARIYYAIASAWRRIQIGSK